MGIQRAFQRNRLTILFYYYYSKLLHTLYRIRTSVKKKIMYNNILAENPRTPVKMKPPRLGVRPLCR